MEDPTAAATTDFLTGVGPDVAANLLTVGLFAFLYALKKLCSRDSKCKLKCHTCCFDVEVADRTLRADQPPSVSEDDNTENRV